MREGIVAPCEQAIRSDMRALVDAWSSVSSVAVLPERLGSDPDWFGRALAAVPERFCRDHLFMLTSGSTGAPKLVVGSKSRVEDLVRSLHRVQSNKPVRQAILSLPISYSHSFVNQWLWSHVHGVTLVPTPGLADPAAMVRAMRSADAGMLCLVGVQVPMLLSYLGTDRFPGIVRIHFAGGRFPQERLDALREAFPMASIYDNYGCAEAMPRLTVRRAEDSDEASNVGRPIPGVSLRIGSCGELLFNSRFGAVALVDASAVVREIGPEGWMPTGDRAEECPDGSWRLGGRLGEVFKRYGEKVSLPSLLAVVLESWRGQAAFYRERDGRGEDGHVLVLSPMTDEETARGLIRQIAARFPRAAWPIRVECVDSMPKLASEKIDLAALAGGGSKQVLWAQRMLS